MKNEIIKKEYCEETIRLKEDIEMSFLQLGERLLRIRDERLFENNWDTFEDFLIEVKISTSTASKLINLYQILVIRYEISMKKIALAGGWSVVAEGLPYMTSKEKALDILEKASFLTQTDLRREYQELKTGIPMAKCEHDFEYLCFRTCKKCKLKERDYEKESEKK